MEEKGVRGFRKNGEEEEGERGRRRIEWRGEIKSERREGRGKREDG